MIHVIPIYGSSYKYRMEKMPKMPYKLQVIFRKWATNYRALLRKVTYKDKAPCDVTLVTWSINIVWRRVIGCLICIDHFPQKSPIIRGSLTKDDLQLKTSYGASPPCTNQRLWGLRLPVSLSLSEALHHRNLRRDSSKQFVTHLNSSWLI